MLLTGLLLSNSVLFYKLWDLEGRLIKTSGGKAYSDYLDGGDSTRLGTGQSYKPPENENSETLQSDDDKNHNILSPKTTADWLKLLHRQEVAHQLELEKWHAILGTATDLLRQTEQSLTTLQRNIHPLAIKNLRSLLDFHNEDWSNLITDLLDQNSRMKEPKNIYNNQDIAKREKSPDLPHEPSLIDLKPKQKEMLQEDI